MRLSRNIGNGKVRMGVGEDRIEDKMAGREFFKKLRSQGVEISKN